VPSVVLAQVSKPQPAAQPPDSIQQVISVKPTVGTGTLDERSTVPERFTALHQSKPDLLNRAKTGTKENHSHSEGPWLARNELVCLFRSELA
jgi:hypothetical protein